MAGSNTFHKSRRIKRKNPRVRKKVIIRRRKKHPQRVAKRAAASLSGLLETRRRSSGISSFKYADQGPDQDEVYNGLSTYQAINVVVDPLNYGWQNSVSDPSGTTQFRGKDIFVKWWKMKYKFDFPTGEASIKLPMRVQLVWGFCTNPTQYTPYTTPSESTVDSATYRAHVMKQIEDSFNSPDDQLEFRVKNKSNMRIIGRKWIRPDRTARVGLPQQYAFGAVGATQPYIEGGPPDVTGTITWPMNRKMRLTYTSNGAAAAMNYNNQSWIPFALVYMPDYDSINYGDTDDDEPWAIPEKNRIQFQHNSCLWYQDP